MPTVHDRFARTADRVPDRPLVRFEGETTTYAEASAAVERRAALLADLGVGPGDRVGALLPNDPEFVYLLLATVRLGATFVPFNHRQEGDVLAYLLDDADTSALVVDGAVHGSFRAVRDGATVGEVLVHDGPADAADRDLDAAVAAAPAAPPPADVAPTDVAMLSYTSGTTGPPKGVRNPHRSYVEAGERLAAACDTDETDRALLVLPLFHANPTTYGLMQMLAVGGSVAPVRSFSASNFFATARESGSTFFTHVGSVLYILQETLDGGDVDPETPLRFAVGGAAQFDRREAFEAATGVQLVRLYGLSEVGAGLVTTCRYRPGESGRDDQGAVADGPFDVRILDGERGEFVEAGERGEIVVRPGRPGLMFRGYRGKPAATVEAWQDCWMHTGDLGALVDGRLRYLGRLGSHIRRMGENVSPWEVESALADWSRVAAAVAVGVPDETAGEEIGLVVVPADGATAPTPAEVYERCRDRLPEHLRPRYVAVVDDVPRTSTHKVERERIDRGTLRDAWDATERA